MNSTETLIVGASAAGLACAAQLQRRNLKYILIEQHDQVAHAWRNHYHRLRLHTNKSSSHLPFLKFPKATPKYPSRQQVIDYLEHYCQTLKIKPLYHTKASHIHKNSQGWQTETNKGIFLSKNLIVCTGNTHSPTKITKPGMETFPGKIMHSASYRHGQEFKGQNVLVIGFGNSGGEIAICLHEHGAHPALSVRGAVNVIPRDILGIPVLQIGILQSKLSPQLADKLNRPLINFLVGDISKYGLRKLPYGPAEQIVKHHSIPLLDIGTMKLIRQGHIPVFGDILKVKGRVITFENDRAKEFDAIVMATGYSTGLEQLLNLDTDRRQDIKLPIAKRRSFGRDQLYFCGFHVAPTGMLREINIESELIAKAINMP